MSKAIVFTSGKGGVGKSTLTLSVGRTIAEAGYKVAIMDTDVGLNNLDVLMGVERNVVYDLTDVIEGRCRLRQALVEGRVKGLSLLPSSHDYGECRADGQSIRAVVERLKAMFEYVLIDCPAGIEFGFHRSVAAADEAIVVTSVHLSALKDAAKVCDLISSYQLPAGMVLNRVRGDMLLSGEALTVPEIERTMGVKVIGVIPEDDELNLVSSGGGMIQRHGDGATAVRVLAENIITGENILFDVTRKYRGIFGGVKRRLRGRV